MYVQFLSVSLLFIESSFPKKSSYNQQPIAHSTAQNNFLSSTLKLFLQHDYNNSSEMKENDIRNPGRPSSGTDEYCQQSIKKKRAILHRINTQKDSKSPQLNDSKLSLLKGASPSRLSILRKRGISQGDVRMNESSYLAGLTEKYVGQGASHEKLREQLLIVLEDKKSELEALRVHRDQLKFLSYNNPYDMPVRLSLRVLREKARCQQSMDEMLQLLQEDIRQIDFEFSTMSQYYNMLLNSLKSNNDEDVIIDTAEEEKLMIDNLERETSHLFRELKEEDKKNAREIKNMQEEITDLRIGIKQKQDKIRDLKSLICTLHIKLHGRSSSKEKNITLSVRNQITQANRTIKEVYIGNSSHRPTSRQILDAVQAQQELTKIIFEFEPKKEVLIFRCIYGLEQGKIHAPEQMSQEPGFTPRKTQYIITQIQTKKLLSIKFYFKSKIVGAECRMKTDKGTEHIMIGTTASELEHELLTLINKRIVTVGSFWRHRNLIGVGIWFCIKPGCERGRSGSKARSVSRQGNEKLKKVRSSQGLKQQQSRNEFLEDYYYK